MINPHSASSRPTVQRNSRGAEQIGSNLAGRGRPLFKTETWLCIATGQVGSKALVFQRLTSAPPKITAAEELINSTVIRFCASARVMLVAQ